MSNQSVEKRVRLVNATGLHMRPADKFVRVANRFSSDVQIAKDDQFVDGKSILSILTLAADHGAELTIVANGSDASQAVTALAELVENGFAEDVQQDGTQLAGEH